MITGARRVDARVGRHARGETSGSTPAGAGAGSWLDGVVRARLRSSLIVAGALTWCSLAASPAAARPLPQSGIFGVAASSPRGERAGAASLGHRLDLLLALRADDAGLARHAAAVSTPGSPAFGRYLSPGRIARRFGSSAADRRRVTAFLRSAGLRPQIGLGGFWVRVPATVAQAGRLFSTRFAAYRARATGARFVAPTDPPRLPSPLDGLVTGVVGLSDEPAVGSSAASAAQATGLPRATRAQNAEFGDWNRGKGSSLRGNLGTQAGCAAGRDVGIAAAIPPSDTPSGATAYIPAYTPNQVQDAYGLTRLHRRGLRGQGQRIAVIEIQGFSRSDLETAGACFGYTPPPTPVVRVGLGQNLPPGDETTLDLQVIAAAAPGLEAIRVIEGPGTLSALVRQFAEAIDAPARHRPSVISASLGSCEAGLSGSRPYVDLMERTLKSAAAAGITVTVATGDTGSTACSLADNSAAVGVLSVEYPSSSRWATAVGGTNVSLDLRNRITEEVAWRDAPVVFGGGVGGYSLLFDRPRWQRGPGVGSGRGVRSVPDLSLVADLVPGRSFYSATAFGPITQTGWAALDGTSAATPLFAAGVAIANQQARAAGEPRLGFLNPSIYTLAGNAATRRSVFRDVLRVSNDLGVLIPPAAGGDNGPAGCCAATRNYDRASGWGSVDFPRFSREARKLKATQRSGRATPAP